MKVVINGEPGEVEGITVGDVVDGYGKGRRGVAVALNEEVVFRSEWDRRYLAEGDRVEILVAAQGG